MRTEYARLIAEICHEEFGEKVAVELTRPDEQFGDFSTNVAMQLAAKTKKNPREIAEKIAAKLRDKPGLSEVNIAGPGFINFHLKEDLLYEQALSAGQIPLLNKDKEILVEFGDPNPFKEMHIGHLYSYIVGDSISRLYEASGAQVRRLSYHGDVGLHVAKTIWAMQQSGQAEELLKKSVVLIGEYYQKGAKAYEEDENAKAEIDHINEHIYKKDIEEINKLYDFGKEKSLDEFTGVLADLRIKTDKKYMESESAGIGLKTVDKNLGSVFKKSDGAIIYEGEKVGLHTRVFVSSRGLPTYEAKDLGLVELKNEDYPKASRSIVITAHEQSEYFKVMLAALREIDKSLAEKTVHLTHGFVTLSTGKMSSRKGTVYATMKLLVDVENEVKKNFKEENPDTTLGAIKYGFLKNRLGGDIVYSVEEAVALEGNSGPYLQYALVRARSILNKLDSKTTWNGDIKLDQFERSLARQLSIYPEAFQAALNEYSPHHICNYLYELAQVFNRFYENSRVSGDPRQGLRAELVRSYEKVLSNGLDLLGMPKPEKM